MAVSLVFVPLLVLLCWPLGSVILVEIIGGKEAIPHSHPYIASLQVNGRHVCGATLVHPQWVLTAAHCLNQGIRDVRVVLGLHKRRDSGRDFTVKKLVYHPEYKKNPEMTHDLLLLQLDKKVTFSNKVACAKLPKKKVPVGAQCRLAGWGLVQQPGQLAESLKELNVKVMDSRMCNNSRFWHGDITPDMMCVESVSKGTAPCKGDSGGPLVCDNKILAGVMSFSSKNCVDIFKPPVLSAVITSMQWIKKTLRQGGGWWQRCP